MIYIVIVLVLALVLVSVRDIGFLIFKYVPTFFAFIFTIFYFADIFASCEQNNN